MFNHIIGTAPLLVPRRRVNLVVEYAFSGHPFAWANYRQYNKGGNVFEDIGNSVVSFVKDPISYTGDRLAEVDKAVIQPIYREVIQPVGSALEKIGQGIAKDPVTFLAQVAAVAAAPFTAGQSLWALPVIAAASTAAKGGSLEQVLTATAVSAATAYVGASASGWIMSGLSQASAVGPSFALAGTPISFSTAQTLAQVGTGLSVAAVAATGAKIQGQDPLRAAIPALVGTAAGVAVDQIAATDAFKTLSANINSIGKNVSPVVSNAIKGVASAAITGAIQGKDATGAIAGVLASSVVNGLASTSTIVADFFKNNTGNIAKMGAATQGLVANLAASVVANAATGGKAGAAYTGQIMESLANVLGKGVGAAYDSLATTVQSLYTGAGKAADALNTAAEKQEAIRTSYNTKVAAYDKKQDALMDLYDQEDDLIKKYNAANDQATIDSLKSQITKVQSSIKSTINSMDTMYADLEDTRSDYSAAQLATSKAQEAYFAKAKELGTKADLLTNQTNALAAKINKDLVSELDPNFNAAEYKAINNLGSGVDAYTHWLAVGKNEGLATNYDAAQGAIDLEKSRLVGEIAKAQGYNSVLQMSPTQYKAAMDKVDAIYGNNLAQLKDATSSNITQWGSTYGVKSLDNVLGKYDATKASQYTMADLKAGMAGWNTAGSNYAIPEGFQLASQSEVAKGLAMVTYDDNGKPVWITSNGQDVSKQYNPQTGEVESMSVQIKGAGSQTYVKDPTTGRWESATTVTIYGSDNVYEADKLDDVDGFTQLYSLAGMNESALVVDMGEAASKLGIGAAKTIIEVAQSTGNSTLINTAANVVKAGGGFLQSLAGLSVLAGYAPGSTAFGKFSNALVELGKAGNTKEYQAAIANIQKIVGNAEGVGGTLNAIYQGFKSAPAEFLAEYIGVEGFQEVAPFLIGAGASTFAKGAALAKGMGEKFAAEYGAKMGIKAAAMSDIAESVGGAADSAFSEAYKVAKSKGMTDAQATQTALQIATQTGIVSGLLTAGSMGIGGLAMEKALIGSGTASGLMGKAIDNLVNFASTGGKITIKEGLTEAGEEGLTQAFLEGQLYKLDPTRDIAANITAAAAFGAIAGGPIAGGTYAMSEGTSLISNALMANPTVAKIVSEAKNTSAGAATAAAALAGLGITGPAQADILNKVYDSGYTSTAEAETLLKTYDNFNPTKADIEALTGNITDAQLKAKADAYVDPRVTDFAEAKAMLTSLGYKPTDAEVKKFVGQTAETTSKSNITTYADTHTVTAEEAKQFMKDLGYTNPTQAEINQFVFSGANIDQSKIKTDLGKYVDTHQVTEAEAKKYFADLGYKPTDAEIKSFIKQGATIDQSTVQKGVGTYVDPRQVTTAEATKMLKDAGYNVATANEIAQFVGQGDANKAVQALAAIKTYADTHTVTSDEVKAYFKLQGYDTPTAEQLTKFVAQGASVDQTKVKAAAEAFADPLAVLASEAKEYFAKEGYIPTVEELKAYTGVRNEADTEKLIYAYADPLSMTEAEARAYMKQAGYTSPTPAEVAQFVKQAKEADLKTALLGYVDNHQVTQAEAEAFYKALGYVPTKQEIAQFVTQGVDIQQKAIEEKLSEYVDPRYATADEIRQAYLDLGFGEPTQADIDRFTGQRDEAAAIKEAEEYLPIATYHATKEQIAAVEKSLSDKMAEYEAAGKSRDEALQLAINGVASDLGTTKTQLLSAIGQTEADLITKITATETALKGEIGGVKTELSEQIQDVAEILGKPVQNVTQADIDYVNNAILQQQQVQEGQTAPTFDLTYDVNRDGKIDSTDQTLLQNQLKIQQGTNIETKVDPETGITTYIDTTTGKAVDGWDPQTGSKWAATGMYAALAQQKAEADAKAKAQAATAAKNLDTAKKQSNFNTLLSMIMSAPDIGGQKVTVQQAPLTEIRNIYDFSSIFANPQQAALFPSPYGQVNVFGQSPQAQPGIAGLGALGGQQQQFKFAGGGMISNDIKVGGDGDVDDLLNILKGNG